MEKVNQGWAVQDFLKNFETYHEAYNAAFSGQDNEINEYLSQQVNNYPHHKNDQNWESLWKTLRIEILLND